MRVRTCATGSSPYEPVTGRRASAGSVTRTSRSYHRPSRSAASSRETFAKTRRPLVHATSSVTRALRRTRIVPVRDRVATWPARSRVPANATAPSTTAMRSRAAPPYACTPNLVPMSRMAPLPVCTTKGRAASCTTLKYASPSRYTSRWRAAKVTGARSLLSALRVISVPSSSRRTARRPRGAAYSRMAGACATERASRPSHQAAPAAMTAATTAAAIARLHRPDRLGPPYPLSNRRHAASTSYGAPSRRASASQAACSVATTAWRAGSVRIQASTAAWSSGPAVPSRYRASAPTSMVGEGGVINPMTPTGDCLLTRERGQGPLAYGEEDRRIARVRSHGGNDFTQGAKRSGRIAPPPQREQRLIFDSVPERLPAQTGARSVSPRVDDEVITGCKQAPVGIEIAGPLIQTPVQESARVVPHDHPRQQPGLQQGVVDQAVGIRSLGQPRRVEPQLNPPCQLPGPIAVVPSVQIALLDHPDLEIAVHVRGLDGLDPTQPGSRGVHAPRERAPGLDILQDRLVGDMQERMLDPPPRDQMTLEVPEEGLEGNFRRIAGR